MRYLNIIILLTILFKNGICQTPANDDNWASILLLDEEFDNEAAFYDKFIPRFPWGNSKPTSLCFNHPDNIVIENGILKGYNRIQPGKYRVQYPKNDSVYYDTLVYFEYTSYKISSKVPYGYGYYEIKTKLPYGDKFWTTFWNKNSSEELDFFEKYPGLDDYSNSTNYHWCEYVNDTCVDESDEESYSVSGQGFSEQFNVFGVEWSPKWLIYYLNGKCIRIVANDNNVPSDPAPIITGFGFHQRPYKIFFPAVQEIDYIKIYELKMDCNSDALVTSNNALSKYSYSVKKRIEIRGEGETVSVPNNEKITMRSVEGIAITRNFLIPLGSEFCFIPTNCY